MSDSTQTLLENLQAFMESYPEMLESSSGELKDTLTKTMMDLAKLRDVHLRTFQGVKENIEKLNTEIEAAKESINSLNQLEGKLSQDLPEKILAEVQQLDMGSKEELAQLAETLKTAQSALGPTAEGIQGSVDELGENLKLFEPVADRIVEKIDWLEKMDARREKLRAAISWTGWVATGITVLLSLIPLGIMFYYINRTSAAEARLEQQQLTHQETTHTAMEALKPLNVKDLDEYTEALTRNIQVDAIQQMLNNMKVEWTAKPERLEATLDLEMKLMPDTTPKWSITPIRKGTKTIGHKITLSLRGDPTLPVSQEEHRSQVHRWHYNQDITSHH